MYTANMGEDALPGSEMRQLVTKQYELSANVRLRWRAYDYETIKTNFGKLALKKLCLRDDETVLDVGCGAGENIEKLKNRGHSGEVIGLDINELLFYEAKSGRLDKLPPIDYILGSADELPLADNSVDAATCLFMLYHVHPEPEEALAELQRVLKPGGRLAIATSGKGNKPKHRQFEQDIADYLQIQKPVRFAEPFDRDVAEEVLPRWFRIVNHRGPEALEGPAEMRFKKRTYNNYLMSLLSMKSAFNPEPSMPAWNLAIKTVVKPKILAEIDEKGYFSDPTDRHLYICINDKK